MCRLPGSSSGSNTGVSSVACMTDSLSAYLLLLSFYFMLHHSTGRLELRVFPSVGIIGSLGGTVSWAGLLGGGGQMDGLQGKGN